MRLDYTIYILAVILLVVTILPFVIQIEGVNDSERNLWVVLTLGLGLLSIGLGYSQRPKTSAQSCKIPPILPETTKDVTSSEKPTKKLIENKIESEVTHINNNEEPISSKYQIELTQIKGIGEKRVDQLNALGIQTVNDLSNESATDIAKKLKISPKITRKWKSTAKKMLE